MTPHCWHGALDDVEFGTPEYLELSRRWPDGATCMLLDGHDGPHEYVSDTDILVSFPEEAP